MTGWGHKNLQRLVMFYFLIWIPVTWGYGFSGSSDGKKSAYNAGHLGLIPELGRFLGEGNDNQFHYSYLENTMNRGAWQATVHEVTESDRNELLTLLLSKQGQKLAKMCISKNYIHFGSGNWRKIHNIKLWVKFYSGTLLKTIALELVSQITPRNCPKR